MILSHLRLLTADLARDVAFYRDTVGLALVVDVPGVYAEFETGATRLAFYRADLMAEVTGRSPGAHGGDAVLCLRVADVSAMMRHLVERGAVPVRETHDQAAWYQRVAHVADPAGRLIELWSPLAAPSSPSVSS